MVLGEISMVDSFISSVASDLAAGLISSLVEALGGPAIEKIRDQLFWGRLMTRVVRKLCTGYEEFKSAEGETLLAIDERYFHDPDVRMIFTEHIIVNDTDRRLLRDRFIDLYGESQIELFERNLNDALVIFSEELEATLSPNERVSLAHLDDLKKQLAQSTHVILDNEVQTRQIVLSVQKQILASVSPHAQMTAGEGLAGEHKAQLDHARDLIQAFHPRQALEFLDDLKQRIWETASSEDKYRLLANMGFAYLQLDEQVKAAQLFIDAHGFHPDNSKALANAALGFFLQGQRGRCQELAYQALEKDPTTVPAYSVLVHSSADDEPFEQVLAKVPEAYQNTGEVAMALGCLARQRGLQEQAEHWLRVSVEQDTQNHPDPRAILADLLLSKLMQGEPAFGARGIINTNDALVKEILTLYNYAWERISRGDVPNRRQSVLVNRATVKAILGDLQGAIHDCDEALNEDTDNPLIVKQRALLAYQTGDLTKAAVLFRQLLEKDEAPDAGLHLATVLLEDGKLSEAEAIAREFLKRPDLEPLGLIDGTRLLVYIQLQAKKLLEAREHADALYSAFPNDPGVLALCASVARYEGRTPDARKLLAEAKSKLASTTNLATQYQLAHELFENAEFGTAAELLARIVDVQVDSPPVRLLVNCYYRAGNLGPALEICKNLGEQEGTIKFFIEVEAAVYQEIDNLPAAKEIYQKYLETFPGDSVIELRLAEVNYRLKDLEALDQLLEQDIDPQKLTLEECVQLARLYLARNRTQKALEVAYETRRQFLDNPHAHLAYVHIFLRCEGNNRSWLGVDRVNVDTAVLLDHLMQQKDLWIIIENRVNGDTKWDEFPQSHPYVDKLLGKKAGDTISISYGFYTEEVMIKEVKSKFVHAFHETLNAYQFRFPGTPGIWYSRVQIPTEKGEAIDGLKPIFNMIDKQEDYFRQAIEFYRQGNVPIGALSSMLSKNPIDIRAMLTSNPEPGVRCCSGSHEERKAALEVLSRQPKLVADITSLMTLPHLGVSDQVVGTYGRIGIVQKTLDLVEELLNDMLMHKGEYWTLGKEGNQYTRFLVTEEIIQHNRNVLKSTLDWATQNCEVIPCTAALNVMRDARVRLGDLIGPSFLETVLVATAENSVLYSDDDPLRRLAATEYQVPGIWTQALLTDLSGRQAISDDVYTQCSINLACLNYRHTSINGQTLLEAARQARWRLGYPLSQTINMLGGSNCALKSAVQVAADYLHLLWLQQIPSEQYEQLIIGVLDAIAKDRSHRHRVIGIFRRAFASKFKLAPLELIRLDQLIQIWECSRVL